MSAISDCAVQLSSALVLRLSLELTRTDFCASIINRLISRMRDTVFRNQLSDIISFAINSLLYIRLIL